MTTENASVAKPPSRRARLRLALAGVGVLLLVFMAVWLFSPVHVDEPVPGTIKTDDEVDVGTGGDNLTKVKRLGSIKQGQQLQVDAGEVAFLFLQGGAMSRVEGPAVVKLVESRRQVDAPSVVQGLLGQRFGADPAGSTKVTTALALEVISGTVAIRTTEIKANATFELKAGNVYSRIHGATVQVAVRSEGEVWWDALAGEPTVGMVSGPPGEEAPVVIPKAPNGLRLVIKIPQAVTLSSDRYGRMDASMQEMVDIVRRGGTERKAGGLDYTELTDPSGLQFLAGVAGRDAESQETFVAEFVAPPPAEEVVAIPGLEVRLLTDADIQAVMPAGVTVHLLPGNTLRLTIGGIPYTVRTTVAGGRLELQGLPFGIDPSAYLSNLPALLTVETDEGVARVSYLPEEPPPPPEQTLAEEVAQEGALPHTSPYFSSIPTPLQVSLDWDVATSNLLLVAWLALVIRVSVAASAHILTAHEAHLHSRLKPVLDIWRPVADVLLAFLHKIPHLLTTLAGSALFLTVINGLLFSLLDIRFRPWEGKGLQVFALMLLGFSAAGMVDPIVRARVMARWKVQHHFALNPGNLFLGVVSVGVSRIAALSPGLLLGNAGGLKAPGLKDLSLAQKNRLVVIGLVATIVSGAGAWFLTLLLPLMASSPLSAGLFQLFRGPLSTFQDICLIAFTASLTKVFFSLLPVHGSPGLTVAAHSRVGWAASFLVSGFLFFHLILNKNTGITQLLQERGALITTLVALSLAGTLALYVASKIATKKAALAKS